MIPSPPFNESQIQTIDEFRERISDILDSEFEKSEEYLSRWLISRNFDIERAEGDLRKSKAWKSSSWELIPLDQDDMAHMTKQFPIFTDDFDKDGRTLVCLSVGKWPVKNFLATETNGRQKMVKYVVQTFDRLSDLCKEQHNLTGGVAYQLTLVCDMQKFSLKHITSSTVISVAIDIVKTLESHYPGIVHKTYVINTPVVAAALFTAIRPFISSDSKAKLNIFNSNKEKWETAMADTVDISKLKLI